MTSYNELYGLYRKPKPPDPPVDELAWRLDEVGEAADRQIAIFYASLTPEDRRDLKRWGIDVARDLRPLGFPNATNWGYLLKGPQV